MSPTSTVQTAVACTSAGKYQAYIGLGANLKQPLKTLQQALDVIAHTPGIQLSRVSPFYSSSPVDSSGPDYVNAVALLTTTLKPLELLHTLQAIELQFGRERPYRNAPRTLDLDLLIYDNKEMQTTELTLPHPRMHERAFVLQPLNDIAPMLYLAQGNQVDLLQLALAQGQIIYRISE